MTKGNTAREVTGFQPGTVDDEILSSAEPLVLRGLAAEWPMVKAAKKSARSAADYIRRFYSGEPLTASFGAPDIEGRVGYNDDLTGFNFERGKIALDDFLDRLFAHIDDDKPPASYVGSTVLNKWFPGFRDENDLVLQRIDPLVSLWIGNQTRVSAHFDFPDNIACCVAGRRRFTLFPPDQLENLYVGPWDLTPAGQAISLVDFRYPDFDRFPKFRQAQESALVVTLEPGDALFLPSMWWHHVEGLDGLNMLVNYWWRSTPAYMGTPLNVLKHALLGLGGLPPEQRRAWQHIFEYYVFDRRDDAISHIPEKSRGMLGSIDDIAARKLRADILNQLNR